MNSPTWSDLNSPSIVPPLGTRQAPRLGPVGLMISCEPDFRLIRAGLEKPETKSFFNSTLITLNGDKGTCAIGPFIGAPYAAMLLESMIAQGVQSAIVLGWCGAVSDTLKVGDLVVPSLAIADEGTSRNYVRFESAEPGIEPDFKLSERLIANLEQENIPFTRAPVWTTDAIYRETPKKISYFRDLGARAVEMECSALFAVGRFRQIPVTALLVVSDSVASKDWDPGFRNKQFKSARKQAIKIITALAGQIV